MKGDIYNEWSKMVKKELKFEQPPSRPLSFSFAVLQSCRYFPVYSDFVKKFKKMIIYM